jgi:hypothetical protein
MKRPKILSDERRLAAKQLGFPSLTLLATRCLRERDTWGKRQRWDGNAPSQR